MNKFLTFIVGFFIFVLASNIVLAQSGTVQKNNVLFRTQDKKFKGKFSCIKANSLNKNLEIVLSIKVEWLSKDQTQLVFSKLNIETKPANCKNYIDISRTVIKEDGELKIKLKEGFPSQNVNFVLRPDIMINRKDEKIPKSPALTINYTGLQTSVSQVLYEQKEK